MVHYGISIVALYALFMSIVFAANCIVYTDARYISEFALYK